MKRSEVVSASEIASWAWCPESWRLDSLGVEPSNRVELARGKSHHAAKSAYEVHSRSAMSLGWFILAVAVLVGLAALLAILLAGGS